PRPARLEINAVGPVDLGIGVGGQELSRPGIEQVEEAVLGRLHDHVTYDAADIEIGRHDVLGGRVIPGFPGRGLVMPYVLTRVRTDGNNRREKQVVTTTRTAPLCVPGGTIADTDVDEVGLRIIGDGVPYRTAATQEPPLAIPGFGSPAHGFVLEAVGRVARHGVEAPGQLTTLGIIGAEIASYAELGTGVADQDLALHHAWCTGNRIPLVLVNGHRRPDLPARIRVHGNQAP